MTEIVGVSFKRVGKIYFFDPGELRLSRGAAVIVETVRGIEFGRVQLPNRMVDDSKVVQPLKRVIREAAPEDISHEASNRKREADAFKICLAKIKEHKLDMKLIEVELTFDLTKVVFYFTADGRVDFRELVKDLASIFHMRIELRQIGVRDESKAMNGMGICGRALCCATFLADFQPVSIKMAKEQGLSLNPTKISGICGRLMCCLKYEEETYEELNRNLPNPGDVIRTPDGKGEVISVNVLRQLVKAAVRRRDSDDPIIGSYSVGAVTIVSRARVPEVPAPAEAEEVSELKSILD
ncbi:MAG: stage 0 sporulation family protein [Clostridiales bacterium]|jgi:cell fate regulator YaaT (PSP1 superfamily)|nr:stage 0 sporulation family protein [Clostridiales bacterium]